MRASTRQRDSLPAIALLFAAVAASIGARGGCSSGGLGFGNSADPNAVATGGDPNDPNDIPLDPDPAEASAITNCVPLTVASVDSEGVRMSTVIDENGNVNEFTMFVDDSGDEYLGQYVFMTDAGRLVLDFDPDGDVTTVAVEDYGSDDAIQISLDWTDATQALANMTNTVSNEITAFNVDLSKNVAKALHARAAPPPVNPGEKWESRAEQTFEEWKLSLAVRVRLEDEEGNPVTNLRPVFRLRSYSDWQGNPHSVTCGVVSGEHVNYGLYFALLPAYRGYVADNGSDYLATAADTVGEATTPVGALLLAAPGINEAVGVGVTLVGGILWLESRLNPREYDYAPHPTALGSEMDGLEISVRAGDRTDATASLPISRGELYQHVWFHEEVDLGTLVVEPYFQAAASGYRVYVAPIGPGQLEVLPEGSESEGIPSCQFSGGGLDCTILLQVEPLTDVYPTASEAVLSLCGSVTDLKILPLGVGPAATVSGQDRYLSYEVYDYLATCASQ